MSEMEGVVLVWAWGKGELDDCAIGGLVIGVCPKEDSPLPGWLDRR